MNFHHSSILLLLCNMGERIGLLIHGNSVNVTDTIHGYPGHIVEITEMMQMLLNQTAELENLKQKAKNYGATIQVLQNRVFYLEEELNRLNVSKRPSCQEFSMYLRSMNQLTQNLAVNEANDKNLSQRLSDAVKALNDFKLKDMSTTQHILNQSVELKQQPAKDRHSIQLIHNINFCTIAVTFNYSF